MTFEKLKALIDRYQGEAGTATGGNVDALVYSGLDVHNMLNEISDELEGVEETYAPKIKMTKLVYDWYKETLDNIGDFEAVLTARWEMPNSWEKGYSDAAYQIRSLDDKTLALAWLHPELIEVV